LQGNRLSFVKKAYGYGKASIFSNLASNVSFCAGYARVRNRIILPVYAVLFLTKLDFSLMG